MGKFIDLTGNRYGRLLVLRRGDSKKKQTAWLCRCDCGKEKNIQAGNLKTGVSNSCGCLRYSYAPEHWSGKNSPKWNFNKTYEERRGERKIPGYNEWRRNVYAKFNWKCLICNTDKSHGVYRLNAHHLESYLYNEYLRCDVDNGVTMCHNCHVAFHKIYGQVTTKKDFEDYLNARNKPS